MSERPNDGGGPREDRPADKNHANGFGSLSSSHTGGRRGRDRNAFGIYTCSDCNAVADGTNLRHDDTCPLGRDTDTAMADDARWFAAHPGATERRRPPTWSEVDMLKRAPEGTTWHGDVVVSQIVPGIRVRRFEVYTATRVRGAS